MVIFQLIYHFLYSSAQRLQIIGTNVGNHLDVDIEVLVRKDVTHPFYTIPLNVWKMLCQKFLRSLYRSFSRWL